MANIVDALIVTLGLDSSGVDKGMRSAEASFSRGVKNIVTHILAPLAGTMAFSALVKNYTQTVDALGKLANSLEIGVSDLDAWGDAVRHAGGTTQGFQSSITNLNQKLQEFAATGEGEAKRVFQTLGISAKDASGKVKTPVALLEELAGVADKIDKTKFAGIARKLGLDQGTIQLLQSGRSEVNALVSSMKDLAYTQRDAEVAAEYNDITQDLGKTAEGVAAIFLRILVPALSKVSSILQTGLLFLRKHETFVLTFFAALAAVIASKLTPAIIRMGLAWLANPMTWVILGVMALVLGLIALIEDLWVYIQGGESALDDFWSVFGTGQEISEALARSWEDLKAIGMALWEGVAWTAKAFFNAFRPALSTLANLFKNTLKLIKGLFTGNFAEVAQAFVDIWNGIGQFIIDVFTGAFTFIFDFVTGIFNGIASFFKGIFSGILGDALNGIKNIVSKIPEFLLPESIVEWAKSIDTAVSEATPNMAQAVMPNMPGAQGNALAAIPAALAAAGVVNRSDTRVDVGGIEINAVSNDPLAIATAVGNEINRVVNAGNTGVVGR